MDEMTLHEYTDRELNNAVAIIGFPSLGLISSIATSFLAKQLGLDLIASISSPSFPPYAIIQNGIPMPPVRFYMGSRENVEDDGGIDCEDIVVITSEFVPKAETFTVLADILVKWCRDNNVHTVITLDGIPQFTPDQYSILGVGSTERARELMKKYEIDSVDEGMVRGLSGMLLVNAAENDLDVITLLGSAKQDMPDPRGAAKIMEPLAKMFPELEIDTEPLYKEAEDIEKKITAQSYKTNDNIYG